MNIKRDNTDLKKLGRMCKTFRREHDIAMKTIADDLDYSVESISAFERGKINTSRILLWYVKHGLNADYIKEYNRQTGDNI